MIARFMSFCKPGVTKTLQQTLAASTFFLDNPVDYLCHSLKISQLLDLLITINRQVPNLLHVLDHPFVRISLDLGQLLHSICLAIHNIGQVSHQFILFQQ
jgi:hypothetical protein